MPEVNMPDICKHQFEPGAVICSLCGTSREEAEREEPASAAPRADAAIPAPLATTLPAAVGRTPASVAVPDRKAGDTLTERLDALPPGSILVGVFGPSGSGKTFLNKRLESIVNAQSLVAKRGHRDEVPRTLRDDFTLEQFPIRVGKDTKTVVVVDLPGELFGDSAAESGRSHVHFVTVLKRIDALVLYIAAKDIADFSRTTYSGSNLSTQDVYRKFLGFALATERERRPALFVAVSQADLLVGTDGFDAACPWDLLTRRAPALVDDLIHGCPRYACGYVASHIGGGFVVLNFSAGTDGQGASFDVRRKLTLARILQSIDRAEAAPLLKTFARACMLLQEHQNPSGDAQTRDILERTFNDATGGKAGNWTEFQRTALDLNDERKRREWQFEKLSEQLEADGIELKESRRARNEQPSRGVMAMMYQLFSMLDEPLEGDTDHQERRREVGKRADVEIVPPAWRAGSRLARTPRRKLYGWLGAALLVPLLLAVSILWLAGKESDSRARIARDAIAHAGPLPRGFALEPTDVWALGEEQLEGIRAHLQSGSIVSAPALDTLVRAPNFAVARRANERDVEFEALSPDASRAGQTGTAILQSLDCRDGAICRPKDAIPVCPAAAERTRPLSYACVLREYWLQTGTGKMRAEAENYLKRLNQLGGFTQDEPVPPQFLDRAWPTAIRAEFPVKQALLPLLGTKLMFAHAEYRERSAGLSPESDVVPLRDEFRRYGDTLVSTIKGYLDAVGKLPAHPRRGKPNLQTELAGVGVDARALAIHLAVYALVGSDSLESFGRQLDAHLAMLGADAPTDESLDVGRFAGTYSELLCLHHHYRRVRGERQTDLQGEACRRIEPSQTTPFGAQRVLIDPAHWQANRASSGVEYERYLAAVKNAAGKWLPRTDVAPEKAALQRLLALKPGSGKLSVAYQDYFWLMLLLAAVVGSMFGIASYLSRLRHRAGLLVSPCIRDTEGTGKHVTPRRRPRAAPPGRAASGTAA